MFKKKKTKRIIIVLVTILLVVSIGLAIGGNYFVNYALEAPENREDSILSGSPQERNWFSESAKDMYITSSDGLKLHAYHIKNDTPYANGNYIMVFHGYKQNAASMAHFAMQFYDLGYSVLLPDARSHGMSEGEYICMGWPERLDNLLWIDEIIKMDKNTKIGLFGISMGGSTVINTAGENIPNQVVVAIEDCGYSSAYAEFSHQMQEQFHIPSFPLLDISAKIAKIKTGLDITEADCVAQAKKIKIPTLFIHGKNDNFVPFSMLQELYDAAECEKEMLVIDNAGHGQSATQNPLLYWNTVSRFVEDNMH